MAARKVLCNKAAALVASAVLTFAANAASVTIDSVVQRWPWNNKVDITYTVTDGQTLSSDGGGVFYRLVFNYDIGGVTGTIDGVHDIGASANTGTHTVTWTPPADLKVKSTSCTMTATLYRAEAPSGDDYMIVDLADGAITYEGLLYSQDLSNTRYNIDKYKKTHLALRKIPKGTYYTSYGNKTTDKDYYIAVFDWTSYQYWYLFEGNEAATESHGASQIGLGARGLAYNGDVRGSADPTAVIAGTTASNYKKVIPWLNGKTGLTFDLPTFLMHEIATRAGTNTTYFWGTDSSQVSEYAVCGGATGIVGTKKPNNWGLYDMVGLQWQWVLDATDGTRFPEDVFTPATVATTTGRGDLRIVRGGNNTIAGANFKCDYNANGYASNGRDNFGVRIAYIVK